MKHLTVLCSIVLTSILTMTGCAGYNLGSPVPEELRQVHVPAFVNHTEYPAAGAQGAQQFLDLMIEDGTFSPTTFEDASLRVQVELSGLSTEAVRYDRNYSIVPDEYHLRLTAKLFVYKAATGETLIDGKSVTATDSMLTRGDYQTGIMDALPRLSRVLGQRLLDELHTIR